MPIIGVRELRERTAEVLRQVREEKAEYVITQHGQPVAVLLPIDTEAVEKKTVEAAKESAVDPWELYQQIADEIRRTWPAGLSTQEVIDDIRR